MSYIYVNGPNNKHPQEKTQGTKIKCDESYNTSTIIDQDEQELEGKLNCSIDTAQEVIIVRDELHLVKG